MEFHPFKVKWRDTPCKFKTCVFATDNPTIFQQFVIAGENPVLLESSYLTRIAFLDVA